MLPNIARAALLAPPGPFRAPLRSGTPRGGCAKWGPQRPLPGRASLTAAPTARRGRGGEGSRRAPHVFLLDFARRLSAPRRRVRHERKHRVEDSRSRAARAVLALAAVGDPPIASNQPLTTGAESAGLAPVGGQRKAVTPTFPLTQVAHYAGRVLDSRPRPAERVVDQWIAGLRPQKRQHAQRRAVVK